VTWGRWVAPLRSHWLAWWRGWWDKRHPRADHLLLTQRNVYILPTRAGFMFAVTLLTLLLASINYQLNLGYVLTFLLAGSAVVSMHITHASLRGLNLHLKPITPTFAGQTAPLEVVLQNAGKARYGLGLKLQSGSDTTLAWVDVPAQGQTTAHLGWTTERRGLHATPNLTIETRFPLGLFRAWSVWRPAVQILVYPQPEHPCPPLPASQLVALATGGARSSGGSELEGVRGYRRGDALKLVVWKKAAQAQASGGDLVIRDTASNASQELWLEWQHTGVSGTEERLSRLTAWVLAFEATPNTTTRYGLAAPGIHLSPDGGSVHRDVCLRALALYA
jgi:uncharacterized protein (DUF58 family)